MPAIVQKFVETRDLVKLQPLYDSLIASYGSRDIGDAFRLHEKVLLLQLVYPMDELHAPMHPEHAFAPGSLNPG
jgi:hypothetical protein